MTYSLSQPSSAALGAGARVFLLSAALTAFSLVSTALSGEIRHESFPSKLLDRSYSYTVYLPTGYATTCRRYPVVYLLHGASGDENDWPVKGEIGPTLDRLIASGRLPPLVAIMPGDKGMWWTDANGTKAQSVLIGEMLPEAEARYRVYAGRDGRAFAGLSAGGFATVRLAFTRPDLFVAGAALSPAVYTPVPPANSSAIKDRPFQKNGVFDTETWKSLNWPSLIDGYRAQPLKVALYVNSGDHDRFDIAYHAADLYRQLFHHQPNDTEFRVVSGDHEWRVWRDTIGDALSFVMPRLTRPTDLPTDACR